MNITLFCSLVCVIEFGGVLVADIAFLPPGETVVCYRVWIFGWR